ncbi:hypothetical protein [Veronia pacifica]|uniref:Uncharacterized protein n=1 Tax=Veronia pacifica TaxID=1080227 RepID=A0A1C3E9L8_9GAMM|nr:hypothetical protein [Veronia pacifica]ODA29914.1 hypothetical protein A8L45_21150 [Veronia pacifica]
MMQPKWRIVVILLCIVTGALCLLGLLWLQKPTADIQTNTINIKKPAQTSMPDVAVNNSLPSKTVNNPNTITHHLSDTLDREFAAIASAYVSQVRYPAYSQPITNPDSVYLDPNRFSPTPVPILDGKHSASLQLPKYRFSFPDTLSFRLVSDLPLLSGQYSLIDIDTQAELDSGLIENGGVQIETNASWPTDIRIVAKADFGEGSDTLTADIQFSNPVARLNDVLASYPDGSDIVIPLSLTIYESGIYRVRAVLFTGQSTPVAVLTARQTLEQGENSEITLKAHREVFVAASLLNIQNQPDQRFSLGRLVIERMSSRPGQKAAFGTSRREDWPLGPLALSDLSDEPHQLSDSEKKRLEFLNQMAN